MVPHLRAALPAVAVLAAPVSLLYNLNALISCCLRDRSATSNEQKALSSADVVFSKALSSVTGCYKLLELNADLETLIKSGERFGNGAVYS